MPNLLANINGKQYSSKFKKSLATLSNAARTSNALYGYDYSGVTQPCSSTAENDNPESRQSICALFNGTLKGATYYKGIKGFNNYIINSKTFNEMDSVVYYQSRMPVYQLSDGTLLIISVYFMRSPMPCTMRIGESVTMYTNDSGGRVGNGCYGFIDLNGISGPNEEVVCSKGSNKVHVREAGNCIVNPKDIKDIFPVQFYDGTVEPMTSAGWYVLHNSK